MQTSSLSRIFRIFVLIFLTAFILLPLGQSIAISFIATKSHPDIVIGSISLINYWNIFNSPVLVASISNSLIYVLLNVTLCLLVGLPAAYAFSRFRFIGDRHILLLLLAFRLTPPVTLSLPVFLLFAEFNLVNSPIGIALVHCLFNIPISIWILENFIAEVPREFDEMAFIDGYSISRFFLTRLVPVIAPGIAVAAFFCFIFSWVEVVFARILTVTTGKPITMAINALFTFQTDIGLVMAMTIFSLIPGIVLIYFVRNHISKGFVVRV